MLMNTIRSPFPFSPASSSAALDLSGVPRIYPLPAAEVRARPARRLLRRERRTGLHHSETWYGSHRMAWQRTEFWEAVFFSVLGASAAAGVALSLL